MSPVETLSDLKAQFQNLSAYDGGPVARLIQWETPGDPPFKEWPGRPLPFDFPRHPISGWLELQAEFPIAANRRVSIYGDKPRYITFNRLAIEAGRCAALLNGADLRALGIFDCLNCRDDLARWLVILFDFAFARGAAEGFTLEEKRMWNKGRGMTHCAEETLRARLDNDCMRKTWANYPVDRWYVNLRGLCSASARAIDILAELAGGVTPRNPKRGKGRPRGKTTDNGLTRAALFLVKEEEKTQRQITDWRAALSRCEREGLCKEGFKPESLAHSVRKIRRGRTENSQIAG